jgi:hypothetical protein
MAPQESHPGGGFSIDQLRVREAEQQGRDYQAWLAAQHTSAPPADPAYARSKQLADDAERRRLKACVARFDESMLAIDRFMRILSVARVEAVGFGATGQLTKAGLDAVNHAVPDSYPRGPLALRWDTQAITDWFLVKVGEMGIAPTDRFCVVVRDRWRALLRGDSAATKTEPPIPAWRFDNVGCRLGDSDSGNVVFLLEDGRLLHDNGRWPTTSARKLELVALKRMAAIVYPKPD